MSAYDVQVQLRVAPSAAGSGQHQDPTVTALTGASTAAIAIAGSLIPGCYVVLTISSPSAFHIRFGANTPALGAATVTDAYYPAGIHDVAVKPGWSHYRAIKAAGAADSLISSYASEPG
jgi:hypothetical protein